MTRNPPLPLLSDKDLVNILALSHNATAIYTSEDLIIESANNAMLAFWGKDNTVIGQKLEDVVPPLTDNPLLQLLKNVWHTGVDYDAVDVASDIHIKGQLQTTYFDQCYRAVKNTRGGMYCILHTAKDVTYRSQKRQEVKDFELVARNLNENLAVTNEELEATNEELATTNEEYTILNEELNVANKELLASNDELLKARNTLGLAIDAARLITWTAQLGTDEFVISDNGLSLFESGDEDLTFASFLKRIADEYRDVFRKKVNQAIESKARLDLEVQIKATSEQKPKWYKLNAIPYYNEDSSPSHLTGTMLDVTEQKEDDQRKNDFIAMVSHELKTPLTSLKAYVQMLAARAIKADDSFRPLR